MLFFFFFNDTATTEIYTLSLHDALPISKTSCHATHSSPPCLPSSRSPRGATWSRCGSKCGEETGRRWRSEEHTSELQSRLHLVCRLLLEKKKKKTTSDGNLAIIRLISQL